MDISTIAVNDWKNNQFTTILNKMQKPVENSDKEKLQQACKDFESIFIKMMLDSMKKSITKSEMMGARSQGEEIFEDMLYEKYAENMADQADFGIARLMYQQLKQ